MLHVVTGSLLFNCAFFNIAHFIHWEKLQGSKAISIEYEAINIIPIQIMV